MPLYKIEHLLNNFPGSIIVVLVVKTMHTQWMINKRKGNFMQRRFLYEIINRTINALINFAPCLCDKYRRKYFCAVDAINQGVTFKDFIAFATIHPCLVDIHKTVEHNHTFHIDVAG